MPTQSPIFSIVVLTYNREKYLKQQLPDLAGLENVEVIIVDNCSEDNYSERLSSEHTNVRTLRLEKNFGAVGRNYGIEAAKGKYVVTLDDDVWGITNKHLSTIESLFNSHESTHGICFKVLDETTQEITNWCHHCDPKVFSTQSFETYEISEGAVAFRRSIFDEIGFYPLEFFISHEGPDLAFRILNANKSIIYHPDIEVIHAHAVEGRKSWRRYYYDTRNLIWLAYRNYNLQMLITRFPIQIGALLIYSLRDGFSKYYAKAIYDSIKGLKALKGTRNPVSKTAYAKMNEIDKNKPPITYYIKKRLIRKGVRI